MKLLDAAIIHEDAVPAVVAAGIFGGWRLGVGGSVRQKLEAQFTIRAGGDWRVLN
jgi:hypothetical protein